MRNSSVLSRKEKIAYALGDASANIAWRPLMSYLTFFYVTIVGLDLAAISCLLLFTRLSDGITDVIMGTIADRTKTKWGKFRPWLLWTAIPFGLFLVLVFTTPDCGYKGKLTWAYFTLFMFYIIYTMNNVPYSALMGVMTSEMNERNSLSSYRFFGAYLGGIIAVMLIPSLVDLLGDGDEAVGYKYTMYLLAVGMVIFTLITFRFTKERVTPAVTQKTSLKGDFKDLITNKPWSIMLCVGLLFVINNSIKQGIAVFYFRNYLDSHLDGVYLGALLVVSIIATLVSSKLANRYGKKELFMAILLLSLIANAFLFFIGPNNVTMVFVLGCISEFFVAISPVLFFSMLADTADYSEWKNGRRATGLVFSAGTLAMKFGGGIGGALMLLILKFYDFDNDALVQSAKALNGIKLNMSIVPGIFLILAIIMLCFYSLDKSKMTKIEKELSAKRQSN